MKLLLFSLITLIKAISSVLQYNCLTSFRHTLLYHVKEKPKKAKLLLQ